MKPCKSCGVTKPLTDYYAHKAMRDGRLSDCKECVRKKTSARYRKKREDPLFVEQERKRGRDKYYKYGYKRKSCNKANRKYLKRFPEILAAHNAVRRKLSPVPGKQAHHWSYKKEHKTCVFYLEHSFHKYVHRFIKYDKRLMCFTDKSTGVVLDTRRKHSAFIESLESSYSAHVQHVLELKKAS